MIDSPHFDLQEICCPHVYEKYGQFAWNFYDIRGIILINTIRDRIGKAVFVNDYEIHGELTQRGLRCPECQIVKDYAEKGILYMSGHVLAKAYDFTVQGLVAEEVRTWLIQHANWWPYPFRLESGVSWAHLDLLTSGENGKVILFNK
jgi:hypothetical protein